GQGLPGRRPRARRRRPARRRARARQPRTAPRPPPARPGRNRPEMRAILLGGGLALIISLLGTRVAINYFTRWGYGQEIRDDGPTSHHTKRGTPTMGGVVIISAAVIGYFAAKLITMTAPSAS